MYIMIKTAGMLCILTACILAGLALEQRLKRRGQLFREMKEALAFLEKEMTYHRSPICEALLQAAKRCGSELRDVLSDAAAQTSRRDGSSFRKIWEAALAHHIPECLLSQEETQLFADVSAALCGTDVVMQRTLLGKYADRFRLLSEEEARICREKCGLYRRLTAAAGIFLVILLF